jgi:hypothetical protein
MRIELSMSKAHKFAEGVVASTQFIRKTLTFGFGLCMASAMAHGAAILTLQEVTVVHQYQQTSNSPCVIGESSCQDGLLGTHTTLPAGASSYDAVSPTYTVGTITGAVGNTFMIGVDINQSSTTQEMTLFEMFLNTGSGFQQVAVFSANQTGCTPTSAGCEDVPPTVGGGNGNGYADYLLTGFPTLQGVSSTAQVYFHVVLPSVDDGREQFFLIAADQPAPPPTPEPASMVLTGAGLVSVALVLRRRKSAS